MRYKYSFDDRKKSNKRKIIFIVVALIVAIVISSFLFCNSENKIISKVSSTIIYPISTISNGVTGFFTDVSENFTSKKDIVSQNEKLLEENKNLKYELIENEKIINENKSLKSMLSIKQEYQHFNLKFGRIILREHDNWSKTFTIDIGSKDGIIKNQAVVSENGLVGYISKVNDNTSVVNTILDLTTSVSVNIGTINEPAILKGDASLKADNKLKLEYIQIETVISIGDMLYTSGLGNNYPSTLPVGKIIEIKGEKNDMNRYAIVEPCVDIASISEVGIIIN